MELGDPEWKVSGGQGLRNERPERYVEGDVVEAEERGVVEQEPQEEDCGHGGEDGRGRLRRV